MVFANLKGRSTVDLVVVWFAGIVGVVLILSIVAIMVIEVTNPEVDTTGIIEAESEIVSVIVGAIVGFIAGRGATAMTSPTAPTPDAPATDTPAPAVDLDDTDDDAEA